MYTNTLVFTILLLSNIIFAQGGEVYYNKKLSSSETSTNPIVIQALKQFNEQEFKLSFSSKLAVYKRIEVMNLENYNPVVQSFTRSLTGFRGEAYFDLKNKSTILKKEISGKTFLVKKEPINWKLTKDTLLIGKYLCYKATTNRIIENSEGTHELAVTAWYTTSIPLPYGPDGYGGLPGLILQLEDNGVITFANRINLINNNVVRLPYKGETITESQFNQIMAKKFENRKG